ncbi:MAG: Trm112 family protein [archaeon]
MAEELSKELLEVLACSACGSELNYLKEKSRLVCVKCRKEFRIENGIPAMLLD